MIVCSLGSVMAAGVILDVAVALERLQAGRTADEHIALEEAALFSTRGRINEILGLTVAAVATRGRVANVVSARNAYDERTRSYKGKLKVFGRIADQMLMMIFALLKHDQEIVRSTPRGQSLREPMVYAPTIHMQHRLGHYHSLKPRTKPATRIQLPNR